MSALSLQRSTGKMDKKFCTFSVLFSVFLDGRSYWKKYRIFSVFLDGRRQCLFLLVNCKRTRTYILDKCHNLVWNLNSNLKIASSLLHSRYFFKSRCILFIFEHDTKCIYWFKIMIKCTTYKSLVICILQWHIWHMYYGRNWK